ncbi:hypothetical protein L6164_003975 [Bauhinia variegata]|uniref:Uncharacterized protein n=1 Tax=Bauhinia variegata TaxID=167791 RepID=A0ACB9Q4H6_BAUVA|nr:hypothetical protein L6164_003975 [Bauhinia variegata]
MGLHRCWQITLLIVSFFTLSLVEASSHHDPESLIAIFRDLANKEIAKPRTGIVYNISLPANFTGMQVSVIRLRSASFWSRGVNHSFFNIPPRVRAMPNIMRLSIVYDNLGNWSSSYYNVPNYTMVAPVLGFMAYSSPLPALIGSTRMNFSIQGDPITIRFPQMRPQGKNETPICAKLGDGGSVQFFNMAKPFECITESQGHYALVVPSERVEFPSPRAESPAPEVHSHTLWWVLGFVIGFVGLILVILVLFLLVKLDKRRRIRKMEGNSERDLPFDTFWVGESKMPSASMIRTQPALENEQFIVS